MASSVTSSVKSSIHQQIVTTWLNGDDRGFDDDTDLQGTGILDSFSTLSLVAFIDETFKVQLDPVERGMGLDGAIRFTDQETGEQLETLAQEIRSGYRTAVEAWIEELHQACLARDIDHFVMETDQPLDRALFEYFIRRSQLF